MVITTEQLDKAQQAKDIFSFGAGVSNFMATSANWNILQGNFDSLELGADSIKLQAIERANQLRESFNSAIGDYVYMAEKRGFKSDSGSARANIEMSSMNLGKDISAMEKEAQAKSEVMKAKARAMKAQQGATVAKGLVDTFTSFGGMSWQ